VSEADVAMAPLLFHGNVSMQGKRSLSICGAAEFDSTWHLCTLLNMEALSVDSYLRNLNI
jgi:hypothetical protein